MQVRAYRGFDAVAAVASPQVERLTAAVRELRTTNSVPRQTPEYRSIASEAPLTRACSSFTQMAQIPAHRLKYWVITI